MDNWEGASLVSRREGVADAGMVLCASEVECALPDGSQFQAVIRGRVHEHATARRMMPLSSPRRWIAIISEGGRELGILDRLDGLPVHSREVVEAALEQYYFMPRILQIRNVRNQGESGAVNGRVTWDVETDRGEIRIRLPNIRDHIEQLPGGRVVVVDADGQRFDVTNVAELDVPSRAVLGQYMRI